MVRIEPNIQSRRARVSSIFKPLFSSLFVGLVLAWIDHVADAVWSYKLFQDFLPFLIPLTIVAFSIPNIILGILEMTTKLNLYRSLVNLIIFALLFAYLASGYYEAINNVGEVNEAMEIIKMGLVALAITAVPILISFLQEGRSD